MEALETKKKKLLKGVSFTKVDVIKPGFEHMGYVSPGPTPTPTPPTPTPTVTPGPFPGPSVFEFENESSQ